MQAKTILVTGSSRGIGKAVAKLAHKQGYKVIVHGRTDSEELNLIHQELEGSMKTFFDVSDKEEAHKEIGKLLNEIGKIDCLVNNAGIAINNPTDISDVDDEKALKEYKVNVLGMIHCIQAVMPSMIAKRNGSIVNIASVKSYSNYATLSSLTYGFTKSAVLELTKALAKVYTAEGIRINAVSPGYTKTDIAKNWKRESRERVNNGILLDRLANTEEIAPLILFLLSDEASYITGSDFLVDGGYTLKGK